MVAQASYLGTHSNPHSWIDSLILTTAWVPRAYTTPGTKEKEMTQQKLYLVNIKVKEINIT